MKKGIKVRQKAGGNYAKTAALEWLRRGYMRVSIKPQVQKQKPSGWLDFTELPKLPAVGAGRSLPMTRRQVMQENTSARIAEANFNKGSGK